MMMMIEARIQLKMICFLSASRLFVVLINQEYDIR